MKTVLLVLGLSGMGGATAGAGYVAMSGTPGTPALTGGLPMSVRNYSASYTSSSSRSRSSGGVYYGGSSRRHYGGGYSSGK